LNGECSVRNSQFHSINLSTREGLVQLVGYDVVIIVEERASNPIDAPIFGYESSNKCSGFTVSVVYGVESALRVECHLASGKLRLYDPLSTIHCR